MAGMSMQQLLPGLVVVLAACLAGHGVQGDPSRFRYTTCDAHPSGPQGRHQAPQGEPSNMVTTFLVTSSAGTPTQTICPGKQYDLKVLFTDYREALVTASQGSLGGGGSCPNRRTLNSQAESFPMTVSVPCGATGSVLIQVTSATGSSSPFYRSSTQLTVDAACTDACATATSPAATPSKAPSSSTTSPSTNPTAELQILTPSPSNGSPRRFGARFPSPANGNNNNNKQGDTRKSRTNGGHEDDSHEHDDRANEDADDVGGDHSRNRGRKDDDDHADD